jgi:hypothetical protein
MGRSPERLQEACCIDLLYLALSSVMMSIPTFAIRVARYQTDCECFYGTPKLYYAFVDTIRRIGTV